MSEFFDLGQEKGRKIFVPPVPYEGSVSSGTGARLGSNALFLASVQTEELDTEQRIDLADLIDRTPLPPVQPPISDSRDARQNLLHADVRKLAPLQPFKF